MWKILYLDSYWPQTTIDIRQGFTLSRKGFNHITGKRLKTCADLPAASLELLSVLASSTASACLTQTNIIQWQHSCQELPLATKKERRNYVRNGFSGINFRRNYSINFIGADFSFWVPGHNLRDYIRVTLTIGRKMCLRPLNITKDILCKAQIPLGSTAFWLCRHCRHVDLDWLDTTSDSQLSLLCNFYKLRSP